MSTELFVIITVDTEDSQRPAVVYNDSMQELDSRIYGRVNKDCYGLPKIMLLCNQNDCKATFFVSIFDCGKYGNSAIMEVC